MDNIQQVMSQTKTAEMRASRKQAPIRAEQLLRLSESTPARPGLRSLEERKAAPLWSKPSS